MLEQQQHRQLWFHSVGYICALIVHTLFSVSSDPLYCKTHTSNTAAFLPDSTHPSITFSKRMPDGLLKSTRGQGLFFMSSSSTSSSYSKQNHHSHCDLRAPFNLASPQHLRLHPFPSSQYLSRTALLASLKVHFICIWAFNCSAVSCIFIPTSALNDPIMVF